jgi:hypothetical protein
MGDESDLIDALRRAAGIVTGDTFTINFRAVPIDVAYSGGSSSSLTLSVFYDSVAQPRVPEPKAAAYRQSAIGTALVAIRPMQIKLREETSADVTGKDEGIAREHQTGDVDFDTKVYVDSPTTDERVLQLVLSPSTRMGARKLLSLGFRGIEIDNNKGQVSATLTTFASREPNTLRAEEILHAFVTMVSELPDVEPSGKVHPKQPLSAFNVTAGILTGLAALAAFPTYFAIAGAHDCTQPSGDDGESLKDGCGAPALAGLGIGLIAGFLMVAIVHWPLRRRFSGSSNSHTQINAATLIAFSFALIVCFYVTSFVLFANR